MTQFAAEMFESDAATTMQYLVSHRTYYRYSAPVSLAHSQAHLTPRTTPRQTCISSKLDISPPPTLIRPWQDYHGNQAHYFTFERPHEELEVVAASVVDVHDRPWPTVESGPTWEEVRAALLAPRDPDTLAATLFRYESPYVRRLAEAEQYALKSFTPGRPLAAAAMELTQRIFREFRYTPGATGVHTSTAEVFQQRRGVCQDFAHAQITCLRTLGLAARYVSGYLLTDPPPGQPKLIGADASHAWLSVFCPGLGWLDFDPTNNQMPGPRHVTVGWGRDYADVCPIKGVFLGGGHHTMTVAVDVTPIAAVRESAVPGSG